MDIFYTSRFKRSYKKLSETVKINAEKKEKIFRQDPFDKLLKTHKLHGKLDGVYAFSIDPKIRIIFEFNKDKNEIFFLAIGDHDIYE